jgi:hypothetical protein
MHLKIPIRETWDHHSSINPFTPLSLKKPLVLENKNLISPPIR